MPSTVADRDTKPCPYCGYPVRNWRKERTCPAHRDLPALEQLDDRYTETEDKKL